MNRLSKILIITLLGLLILGATFYFLSKKNPSLSTGSFEWKIVRVNDNFSPPDYELDVYLSGTKISDIQAVELDGEINTEDLKVINAETGGFYTNPLTIKMDANNLVFAVAKNPTNQAPIDPGKPLFKLHLRAQSGFSEAIFRILPASQIYVKSAGGMNPTPTQFILQK